MWCNTSSCYRAACSTARLLNVVLSVCIVYFIFHSTLALLVCCHSIIPLLTGLIGSSCASWFVVFWRCSVYSRYEAHNVWKGLQKPESSLLIRQMFISTVINLYLFSLRNVLQCTTCLFTITWKPCTLEIYGCSIWFHPLTCFILQCINQKKYPSLYWSRNVHIWAMKCSLVLTWLR